MKNIIFIIADGMCDYFLRTKIGGKDVCPNLLELAQSGYRFNNVYSQAPYTMAALPPVLSQNDSLNDNNYIAVLNGRSKLVYDDLIDNGYNIFGSFYCDLLYPSRVIREFEYRWPIYAERFMFMELPYVRYYVDHLRDESNKSLIRDRMTLRFLLQKFFDSSKLYFSDVEWSGVTEYFQKSESFPWNDFIKEIKIESEKFYNNPNTYIDELLKNKDGIRIFSKEFEFSACDYLDDKSKCSVKSLYNEYDKQFKIILQKQRLSNISCFKRDFLRIFKDHAIGFLRGQSQTESIKKEMIQFLMRARNFSLTYDSYISTNMVATTGDPSAGKQLEKLRKTIAENTQCSKPYFASVHLMDTHQPFNFFSSEDLSLCRLELNEHINLISSMKKNEWSGNIAYLLAAHYVDFCVGRFLDQLKKDGLLNNTIVVFCADHGLQYGNSPLRDKTQGENYNWESYHIPCIIKDYSQPDCKIINTFYSAKNIFPTVFRMADIKYEKQSQCLDMLDESEKDIYANIEYLGPGQPDIYRKPIIYGLRGEKYYLVCKAMLDEEISEKSIEAIFDEVNDPYELENKKSDLCKELEIIKMLNSIRQRHMEVKSEYLHDVDCF